MATRLPPVCLLVDPALQIVPWEVVLTALRKSPSIVRNFSIHLLANQLKEFDPQVQALENLSCCVCLLSISCIHVADLKCVRSLRHLQSGVGIIGHGFVEHVPVCEGCTSVWYRLEWRVWRP